MGRLRADFSNETVVVTGGASGIGRAIALAFADAGASVVVGDLESEPKDGDVPTHERIREDGGTAAFAETDVTDRDQLEALVAAAREYGGVDVMVNNAGIFAGGPLLDAPAEKFERVHEVNAKGVYLGTKVAADDMVERDDPGVVVNTASISSTHAMREQVQYDASKGSVRMITRGAALELAEEGVRVNAVAPGLVATELTRGWSDVVEQGVADDEFIKEVPLGRPARPEDVARACLFLASEDASYVTGELLYVDGGWTTF